MNIFRKLFNRKPSDKELIKYAITDLAVRLDKLENIVIATDRILKVPAKQLDKERSNVEANIKYVVSMNNNSKKKGGE